MTKAPTRSKVAFLDLDDLAQQEARAKEAAKKSPFPKWDVMHEEDHPDVRTKTGRTVRMLEPFVQYFLQQPDPSGFVDLFVFPNNPQHTFALRKVANHPTFVEVWKPKALEPLPGWLTNSNAGIKDILKDIDSALFHEQKEKK
jgi:hypothetical protein